MLVLFKYLSLSCLSRYVVRNVLLECVLTHEKPGRKITSYPPLMDCSTEQKLFQKRDQA